MARKPDINGEYAQAWQVPLDRMRAWISEHIDLAPRGILDNRVAMWYLRGDAYHPLRSWWVVSLDRLTQQDVLPMAFMPGRKLYAEAEYEVTTWSLQEAPDVNGQSLYAIDGVYDLWHQFHGIDDVRADEVLYMHVEAICFGRTDPTHGWIDQNRESLNALVNAARVGKSLHEGVPGKYFGRRLEVDPYTKRFTGREEKEETTDAG